MSRQWDVVDVVLDPIRETPLVGLRRAVPIEPTSANTGAGSALVAAWRVYYSTAKRLPRELPDACSPNQYANPYKPAVHERTMGEIWRRIAGWVVTSLASRGGPNSQDHAAHG